MKTSGITAPVAITLIFLFACGKNASSLPIEKNDLVGVWALTKVNGEMVERHQITTKGFSYLGTHEDLFFTLEDGSLRFSGNGGAVTVEKMLTDKAKCTLEVRYYDEIKGALQRGKMYLFFTKPNEFYIMTDVDPPWPAFYFSGKDNAYMHVAASEQ